ncbi:MAG: tetratricopeptide repeat protein [Chloroflexi bacterium]|nr:tetratricopeptide repeat protein [Chloroflexota bacterium]
MIDPMVSLAFALHSNRGAYAALVGSGVSVGAGIPTGWHVVLDLISKVARVLGEDPGDDVSSWYQQRFGEEPDYSRLLDTLAKSPAERSALLRSYFEPTAEERASGVKVPGAAHTALAELAVTGHVRLFVTTNFDRLIEQALEAAGVTPRVLSTPDSILGSPPLSQAGCTVLKLHGDYLDTRIKNTPAELDSYDEVVDALLDRIIEEHGFIVCGWSAAWDTALRRAFERSKSRRYTTYWADVVPPGEHASRLIELLHGEFVQVKGADAFFTDMVDKLKSLGDGGGVKTESRAPTRKAKHNLPVQLTSFIGREDEIAEINNLLSMAPLITLTGSGGAGKSRLAQEIGAANVSVYPDGVWLVGLAPLSDPRLIVEEVSSVLGVGEEALYDYLEDKSTLLILDNCEHMVDACAEFVGTLLQRAPEVRVLATSQEALGIAGETVHRVPSLPVPDSPQSSMEALTRCAAVRLFVERAATVQPGFALTDENAVAVAQITQSLDGIPLAIELAAARTNLLSAEQIADRLDDCFRLLTRGRRTDLPRHQTLRGAVEWSYQLLSEPERLLFNQLSVFRGGFTLEAAEEVCPGDGLETYEVLDLLSQLVDKSLVVVEEGPEGEARYRLLEVLRLYGAERLAETGRTEDVRGRHASFFMSLAERAGPELATSQQVLWLDRLESDYDNFRAAMTWAMESGHGETALRVASALFWFWIFHRHVNEGQEWLERALLHSGDASPTVRAIGLARAAALHARAGNLTDFERLNGWLEESLRLCESAGWAEGKTEVLFHAAGVALLEGEVQRASELLDEVWPLLESSELTWGMATARFWQGLVAAAMGDDQQATTLFEQSVALARKAGGHFFLAYFVVNLGSRALYHGDYEQAASLYTESLHLFHELNDLTGVGGALAGLGTVAWLQGDHEEALRLHEEALNNFRDSREGSSIAFCLTCLAGGVYPAEGLQKLVERHNERLDLPPEDWSKEVIAEAVHRSGTAV